MRCGDVAKRQVDVEQRSIRRTGHTGRKQALHLRAKYDPLRIDPIMQWLDAETVARQEQPPTGMIPDRERPHSVEPIEAALAPLRVGLENHLSVGVGAEGMTGGCQLGAYFHIVEHLTVINNDVLGLSIHHRLLTG